MNPPLENELVTVSDFRVTSADTDFQARLRLGAAVNFLIQAAIDSADRLGFGHVSLKEKNLFWVLSRLTLELYRPLRWYETLSVETWPKKVERLLYLRDFILRDGQDQVAARATSGWLAVDLNDRRLKKVETLEAEKFERLRDRQALEKPPEKLPALETGQYFEIRAGYFDIDLNGHVTSTRYLDWMMDTLPLDFHRNYYPSGLSLNIMKETLPEDTIRLLRDESGDGRYLFSGFNLSNGSNAFRATLAFNQTC